MIRIGRHLQNGGLILPAVAVLIRRGDVIWTGALVGERRVAPRSSSGAALNRGHMTSRAKLALSIACPILVCGLGGYSVPARADVIVRTAGDVAAREKPTRPRLTMSRQRHIRRTFSVVARIRSRAQPPAIVASFDDGLAYDTPRDQIATLQTAPWHGREESRQVGLASWYGGKQWQGHRMSDGTRFEETALTAAHASLPLGSLVKVTLVGGDRAVIVRITDRPGSRSRIIDLSRGAAAELGIVSRGVARVRLDPI